MKKKKFQLKKEHMLSFLSASVMLILTYFLLDSNRTYGDDVILIKYSSIIKKTIFNIDPKPSQDELLFINTTYDPSLIEKLDSDSIPIGQQVITDRGKLAKLFNALNNKPDNYRYIICDIFFKDPSPDDSALYNQLKKAKNTIIPYHEAEEGNLNLPLYNVKMGFADYDYIEGSFLKFKLLYNDTVQSIPLAVYKDLYQVKFEKKGLFYFLNDRMCFNNIILDLKVRYFDILESASNNSYPLVHLGEFSELSDSLINETVKNRIILIGDFFEKDLHKTIFGNMPGTIILLNAFLTLRDSDNIIPLLFFPFLFLFYFILSLRIYKTTNKQGYFNKKFRSIFKSAEKKTKIKGMKKEIKTGEILKKTKVLDMLKKTTFGSVIYKFIGVTTLFTLISFLSYFIFNIHINVLIIAFFLEIEKYLHLLYLKTKKNKKI